MTGKCITLIAFRHGFTEQTVGRNKETAGQKEMVLRAHQKLVLSDWFLNGTVISTKS